MIVSIEDIMKTYGFGRKYATKLLNTKGCPILPRVKGQRYRVPKEEFETWLRSKHK